LRSKSSVESMAPFNEATPIGVPDTKDPPGRGHCVAAQVRVLPPFSRSTLRGRRMTARDRRAYKHNTRALASIKSHIFGEVQAKSRLSTELLAPIEQKSLPSLTTPSKVIPSVPHQHSSGLQTLQEHNSQSCQPNNSKALHFAQNASFGGIHTVAVDKVSQRKSPNSASRASV
jgi:hypothetical protein